MKKFLIAAGNRALRTFCQTALSVIGTTKLISDVDWWIVINASVMAALLSVLTSIVTGLPEANN